MEDPAPAHAAQWSRRSANTVLDVLSEQKLDSRAQELAAHLRKGLLDLGLEILDRAIGDTAPRFMT